MRRRGKLSSAVCLGIGAATLSLLSDVPPSHARAADDDGRFEARLDLVSPPPQTCLTGPEHAVFAGGAIAVGPACDDGSSIDLLVVYTSLARDARGGTAAIETKIGDAVNRMNEALVNSLVDTHFELVHVAEVNYDETTAAYYGNHIYRLQDPQDGYMDEVNVWRDEYAADIVSLVVADNRGCGVAFLMQDATHAFEAFAFNVNTCINYESLAHEIGHNMGCHHNRENTNGNGVFEYSFGYQDPGGRFRTVMAYPCPGGPLGGCPRIRHFSNPDVSYLGRPTGVPIDQSDSANNALTLNQTALTVANFRCSGRDCRADFDGSGEVSSNDLLMMLEVWGQADALMDVDGDGFVGVTDLLLMLAEWGPCP